MAIIMLTEIDKSHDERGVGRVSQKYWQGCGERLCPFPKTNLTFLYENDMIWYMFTSIFSVYQTFTPDRGIVYYDTEV